MLRSILSETLVLYIIGAEQLCSNLRTRASAAQYLVRLGCLITWSSNTDRHLTDIASSVSVHWSLNV